MGWGARVKSAELNRTSCWMIPAAWPHVVLNFGQTIVTERLHLRPFIRYKGTTGYHKLPVVPHKAVAEVSKIGDLFVQMFFGLRAHRKCAVS